MSINNVVSELVSKKEETKRISRMRVEGVDLSKLIRMGFNEHPYGMSKKVQEELVKGSMESHFYGDFMGNKLIESIAEFYDISKKTVFIGSGSSSLITTTGLMFLDPGDEVLLCPTFAAFSDMTEIRGGKVVSVPLTEEKTYDLDGLYNAITDKTKMIVICNPNNPTGTYKSDVEMEAFIEKVPDNIVIVLDEAYMEFATAPDCKSMIDMVEKYPNKPIIVLKTYSKYYAMAGVRVGYLIANEKLVNQMFKCPRAMVSNAGQKAAIQALKDQEYYQSVKQKVVDGINYIEENLEKLGCTVYHSQTNFIMFEPHVDHDEFRLKIIQRGILINNPMLCRVSVGVEEENIKFIEAVKEVLEEMKKKTA